MNVQIINDLGTSGTDGRPSAVLVEQLFTRISEISSLPSVAMRIVELAHDPKTSSEDLLEAVRGDPALAMRLMRAVNSAYYSLPEKVANLKQAITLLGFREVCNLALTAYVAQLFQETEGYGTYSRHGLWAHMVASGMVARLLAQTCGRVPPQEAYLAGLLHDLGLVLIDQYLHQPFRRVIDSLGAEDSIIEIESRILGFSHASLGEFVAAKWDLPPQLTTAIGYHHAPEQYDGSYRDMVHVTALANFFCHRKGITSLGVQHETAPPVELFTDLGFDKSQFTAVVQQLDHVLESADILAVLQTR